MSAALLLDLGPRVRLGFAWWRSELAALLPPRLRRLAARGSRRIAVAVDGEAVTVRTASGRAQNGALCRHDGASWDKPDEARAALSLARRHPVALAVPPALVLRQEVTLPRAALSRLDRAVAYGLSTWSPFGPEEVFVAAKVLRADSLQGHVALAYALKSGLKPLLAQARAAGLAPDLLLLDEEGRMSVALPSLKLRRRALLARLDAGLALLAVLLACALAGAVLVRQSEELARVEAALRLEIEALRREEGLRRSLDETAARRTLLARKRAAEPSASELLAGFGSRLPLTASLTLFELAPGRGRIEVAGAGPAEILSALRGAPRVTDLAAEPGPPNRPASLAFKPLRSGP